MRRDPDELMDEEEVAALLGTSRRTLQRLRQRGEGPAYFKVGRKVRFRYGAVLAWLQEREKRQP
jgi:prophage regulatory protein